MTEAATPESPQRLAGKASGFDYVAVRSRATGGGGGSDRVVCDDAAV